LIAMVWIKGDAAIKGDVTLQNRILTPFITMTMVELVLCAFLALFFPIFFIGKSGKSLIKILIFVVVLAIIAAIAYFGLAGNQFTPEEMQRLKVTAEVSRLVGAAIYFTYILGGAAVLTILYSGAASMFKK
ncbi:MAG: hypothetical protein PHQ69_10380, partial [Bacteroidales bacterium]|nr:hypothetical protein [Bacteroidales bacterium]